MEFIIAADSGVRMFPGREPEVLHGEIDFDGKFLKDPQSLATFESLRGIDGVWPSWSFEMTVSDETGDPAKFQLEVDDGYILKDIRKLFVIERVTVQVTFSELRAYQSNAKGATPPEVMVKMSTKEMVMGMQDGLCRDDEFQFPDGWRKGLFQKSDDGNLNDICGKVHAKLTLHLFPGASLEQQKLCYLSPYEKMLQDAQSQDVTIVAQDGKEVKCHKLFLAACSPVFQAMFQAGMKAPASKTIEMLDMTEEAVQAFLEYVYYQGKDKPNDKCGIAFELLCAAHRYQVAPNMEAAMREILVSKPLDWYDVDVAIKLFQFARILPSGDALKMKAFQVLKSNPAAFQRSPMSKEMFEKNPNATSELFQLSWS